MCINVYDISKRNKNCCMCCMQCMRSRPFSTVVASVVIVIIAAAVVTYCRCLLLLLNAHASRLPLCPIDTHTQFYLRSPLTVQCSCQFECIERHNAKHYAYYYVLYYFIIIICTLDIVHVNPNAHLIASHQPSIQYSPYYLKPNTYTRT